jgi:hypothetical protein
VRSEVVMKKRQQNIFFITIICVVALGLSSCVSYWLDVAENYKDRITSENFEMEGFLREEAGMYPAGEKTYMVETWGDIFGEVRSTGGGGATHVGHTNRYLYQLREHPYDYVEYHCTDFTDGRADLFETDYPHFIFGNDAGSEWEKMLRTVFPEMHYLAPEWVYTKEGDTFSPNEHGTWAALLSGLSRESTLDDYLEVSPIHGILLLPEAPEQEGQFSYRDEHIEKLGLIDEKYDINITVIYIQRDYFDELSSYENPLEKLIENNYDFINADFPGTTILEVARRSAPYFLADNTDDNYYDDPKYNIVKCVRYYRIDGKLY